MWVPGLSIQIYFQELYNNAAVEFSEMGLFITGAGHEEPHTSNPDAETAQEGRKRKRVPTDGDEVEANMQHKLIQALENNGRLLSSHLEAQNTNFQLDREQRKDHINSLVQVLNKLADAFGKIADKL